MSQGLGTIIHFYCLAVEAGFYSDVGERLPVDLATWVRQVNYFRSTTTAPNVSNLSYDRSVPKYLPCIHFYVIPVPRTSGTNFKLDRVNVTVGSRYIIHFYCLAVEAGFYSDVVECCPVAPATWVRFPAGTGKLFSLYDMCQNRCVPLSRPNL